MMKFGFIGAGNMGYAMMQGAVTEFGKSNIIYTDKDFKRLEHVKAQTGCPYTATNEECIKNSDVIILSVKPQYMEEVLKDISMDQRNKIFIAIAPGLSIDYYKKFLGETTRIVRAMPNTPALIQEGMSALCYSEDDYQDDEKADIIRFFNSFGETIEVTEEQLDMVVPVSGSSPAYVYMMIEAMADAGVLFGLQEDKAYKLAAQAVYGSAKMVLETGMHPGVLKDAVCSPGGTTIEAVAKLEEKGFRSSIIEAMKVCYQKTLAFSKKRG